MEAMRNKLTLGERILTARRRVKASQDVIAAECGTTRQQVGKWEHGTAVPDLREAVALARFTKTPLEWFVEAIDLRDQDSPNSWCNSVEQLDLFSLVPQAADVRSGGAVWEFSDRLPVDTSRNAEDVASGLTRQLVA